jgi:hypothetical protein
VACGPNPLTWAIVPGATSLEQWPAEFPPINGYSLTSDDSRAVIKSGVGSLYQFRQEISIYGAIETFSFRVRASTRNGSLDRIKGYLDNRGTARSIAMNIPGSEATRWTQARAPQYEHKNGFQWEVSITLEQDRSLERLPESPGGPPDDSTPPIISIVSIPDITAAAEFYEFTIRYSDTQSLINSSSISDGDIQVLRPDGISQSVIVIAKSPSVNAASVDATYRLAGPFSNATNGNYSIYTIGNQISDVAGNSIGSFLVDTFACAIAAAPPSDTTPPTIDSGSSFDSTPPTISSS